MLRFLKATLFLAILLAGGAVKADTFVFKDIGIAIDTPEGWVVLSASANSEFLSTTNVTEEMKEMSRASSKTQILSMARENPPIGVSPGIHINFWPGRILSIEAGLRNVVISLRENVPQFSLVTGPTSDKLGEFEAGFVSYEYEVITPQGPFVALEKFWLIPMGENYLTISTGVSPDESTVTRNTIEEAVHSLRRVP